ncbi:penicillin-binding protein 1C, partial [Rhizobium ruizarguesonis]
MRRWHKFAIGSAAGIVLAGAALFALDAADKAFPPPLDKAFPPPLDRANAVSAEVLDADGQLLRAFATSEGRWRLTTAVSDVDPQ